MKTITEYLLKGHITNYDPYLDNIIEKDDIQCIYIGENNTGSGKKYYLSLPSIESDKLVTRKNSKILPAFVSAKYVNEIQCTHGWHIPYFFCAQDYILPFIQQLTTEQINAIFCNNMDYLKMLPYIKIPVMSNLNSMPDRKIEINIKQPKLSKLCKLGEHEENLFGCFVKIEI